MKYTLRIIKTQPDHLGELPPVQEFADRFASVSEARDYAEALIARHEAPPGAYSYDILDDEGQPVVTDAE